MSKKYQVQNPILKQTQQYQVQNPILKKDKSNHKLHQQIYRDIENNVPIDEIISTIPNMENPKIKTMVTQMLNFFKIQNSYFENVTIIDKSTNLEIQNEILKELFFLSDGGKSLIVRMNDLTIFSENLFQQDEKLVNNRSQSWKQCKDKCATTLKEFIQREFDSTVFMIRLIFLELKSVGHVIVIVL